MYKHQTAVLSGNDFGNFVYCLHNSAIGASRRCKEKCTRVFIDASIPWNERRGDVVESKKNIKRNVSLSMSFDICYGFQFTCLQPMCLKKSLIFLYYSLWISFCQNHKQIYVVYPDEANILWDLEAYAIFIWPSCTPNVDHLWDRYKSNSKSHKSERIHSAFSITSMPSIGNLNVSCDVTAVRLSAGWLFFLYVAGLLPMFG